MTITELSGSRRAYERALISSMRVRPRPGAVEVGAEVVEDEAEGGEGAAGAVEVGWWSEVREVGEGGEEVN